MRFGPSRRSDDVPTTSSVHRIGVALMEAGLGKVSHNPRPRAAKFWQIVGGCGGLRRTQLCRVLTEACFRQGVALGVPLAVSRV
eukprot:1393747-Amorphochlora_amoeboformis.AAC.1